MKMSNENQRLVSELCRQFHSRGQAVVPGTGVAIKEGGVLTLGITPKGSSQFCGIQCLKKVTNTLKFGSLYVCLQNHYLCVVW